MELTGKEYAKEQCGLNKMETNEKILVGFVLVIATLGSAGLTTLLDSGNPTYICESKDLVSDCVNGVKASGTRCYYSTENSYKYEYCKEGWKPLVKELEQTSTEVPSGSGVSGNKYLCDQVKCILIN